MTGIVSHGPWWGKEEQTASVYIPLMTGTEVSHNSEDNPTSCVHADGSGNMSPPQAGCKP